MNAVVESVRSLWVPLDGINLLVPNVAIAEVINYQPLDLLEEGPEWLLGSLRWRDQQRGEEFGRPVDQRQNATARDPAIAHLRQLGAAQGEEGRLRAGEGGIAHLRPVGGVDRVEAGLGDADGQFGEILVVGIARDVTVGDHDVQIAVVVEVPESPGPAPAPVVDSRLEGDVAERVLTSVV